MDDNLDVIIGVHYDYNYTTSVFYQMSIRTRHSALSNVHYLCNYVYHR